MVPRLNKKRSLATVGKAAVLYPHEMWAFLSEDTTRFQNVFMPSDPHELHTFWEKVRNEVWMQEHPLRFLVWDEPTKCIPILIYGDEAPMGKLGKRLLRMGLWYSPFRKHLSVDGNLASHMDDMSDPCAVAIHQHQLRAVAWSFTIAMTNKWPYDGHDGRPLTAADGYRFQRRGQPLNPNGAIPVVIGFTGDLQRDDAGSSSTLLTTMLLTASLQSVSVSFNKERRQRNLPSTMGLWHCWSTSCSSWSPRCRNRSAQFV